MLGEGTVTELVLVDGGAAARITCAAGLLPAPGQYLLAHLIGSDAPLATVLFAAQIFPAGFLAAPLMASTWVPGAQVQLRGPLGHGFVLPASARRIALVAFQCPPRTLLSLLEPALRQDASVVLIGDEIPDDLPLHVEAQPVHALRDACHWADYSAFDLRREALPELTTIFQASRAAIKGDMQALIRTPMPCGARADCGACTVVVGSASLLACDDGPVFDFRQLMGWSSRA